MVVELGDTVVTIPMAALKAGDIDVEKIVQRGEHEKVLPDLMARNRYEFPVMGPGPDRRAGCDLPVGSRQH
ncbi:hypothetical protein [Qingshengfaniella alkalisoli]|uniref:Uncharacterized protein n=1 Tax=Qingshengfaniella alkalisoli TaxID=2599296 RepID=A0A5B8JAX5_9RHOB|nr:hypothetical protein [Qingshengfaniella alkalisoli]QDY71310.1 hypothetical protein FPZ52_16525 [Qingshengfaniella alkalisoli]